MKTLIRILISAFAVIITSKILPGVYLENNFFTALIVALVLSVLNAIIKPILIILTIPITIFTFGLFLIVINALMIMLTARLVDGFRVDGFWTALLFSIILSFVTFILNQVGKGPKVHPAGE